jgi:hypothetical protein
LKARSGEYRSHSTPGDHIKLSAPDQQLRKISDMTFGRESRRIGAKSLSHAQLFEVLLSRRTSGEPSSPASRVSREYVSKRKFGAVFMDMRSLISAREGIQKPRNRWVTASYCRWTPPRFALGDRTIGLTFLFEKTSVRGLFGSVRLVLLFYSSSSHWSCSRSIYSGIFRLICLPQRTADLRPSTEEFPKSLYPTCILMCPASSTADAARRPVRHIPRRPGLFRL